MPTMPVGAASRSAADCMRSCDGGGNDDGDQRGDAPRPACCSLAAAVRITVTTPQRGSRACQRYTPPTWRRCVAAVAAYLTRS
jgi:hypothetical protein